MTAGGNSKERAMGALPTACAIVSMSTHQPVSDIADVSSIRDCPYPYCDSQVLDADHEHSYCSDQCFYRSRALAVFEDVNHDRRFCSNCYTQIREIIEPGRFMRSRKVRADVYYRKKKNRQYPVRTKDPDDPYAYFRDDDNRHAAVPLSVPTKETINSGESRVPLSDPHPDSDYSPASDPRPSSICSCGAIDDETTVRPVKRDQLMEFAKNLSDVVSKLHAEDEHPHEHDRTTFLSMVHERKTSPEFNDGTPDQQILINALADGIEAADSDSDQ